MFNINFPQLRNINIPIPVFAISGINSNPPFELAKVCNGTYSLLSIFSLTI